MAKGNPWVHVTGKRYDAMMGRCYRPTDKANPRYASLGIKVASAWIKDINVFREWCLRQPESQGYTKEDMIKEPKRFSLDRIDCLGHYTPENCRLVDVQTQSRNKVDRKVMKIISAEGEEIVI